VEGLGALIPGAARGPAIPGPRIAIPHAFMQKTARVRGPGILPAGPADPRFCSDIATPASPLMPKINTMKRRLTVD